MNYEAIVLAAGQGKRMNAGMNKQFIELGGEPLIVRTLKVFDGDERCNGIVLVVNPTERGQFEQLFERYRIRKVVAFADGGQERQHSVYNGLQALRSGEIVLIHDGARPFVRIGHLHELADAAVQYGAAIPAVRVKDTIKKVDGLFVEQTIDRSSLWAVQTPQAFRLSLIMEAHEEAKKAGYLGTDDASLVERLGRPVKILEGDYRNIKLTTPEDLLFAEAILASRIAE
ncbi:MULTISPECIES: 2-C-methyl-D-erythritol 4-phosphate cytidylyltransferase [Geobacillus]|jgi:2-C-methyl-D-erythritol 4-phosphate cytidylyltransferase|uniref:2-C-methyl-D-erythritol 4-phosphate cytidylyltransferase n=1 Tax=Geobacillus thermodenitrificans TaxID=33940 RepID=A0ABY9QBU4_GEOTD|nr:MULTISPECIES: 2-C-methyl-D-erythritol 4-phosphate cytidylyltransferase [Geobacillus]ARA98082.1 2-C-methyl-D-erythritol 4-phosphate cytidylyltransferase [Geobacillus thermodenitrificans]ARP41101.1 2-C-methyl-D-erythritol 4-phosphate cytidylyltransferase [Geobacillus thermodenitrificans]ATO37442.1 2-C-methyl-D-erythritol 4-phosphate cytidylyltransferase [Geobacillus thermodenitrificans]KQB94928.1 2-C-methyl-D-erythritol 4-phosphate cytidylyltransferase [Geobacillus sp. PA-3]MED0664624.1 2-C-m